MYIDNIFFSNFKNFELKNIKTDKINIIHGKNASGKTNTIEGIYTVLNGHSFKSKNTPLQKDITKKTVLSATINNTQNIYVEIYKGKKNLKLNTKRATALSFKKNFPSILYSIDSFISFKDKKYLFSLFDRNIFIDNTKIANMLIEYKKLIRIKKEAIYSINKDLEFIKFIHEKVLNLMRSISIERVKSVEIINSIINKTLNNFTDKQLYIEYKPYDYGQKNILKEELLKKRLITSLNKDKINILLNNKDIFTYASIGEKKIVLLSLILSIVLRYNEKIKPILLIDDLEGDLDEDSKNISFKIIKELPNQLFLTTLGEYLYNDANIIRL